MVFFSNVVNGWGYVHGPHRVYKRMQTFRFTWVG